MPGYRLSTEADEDIQHILRYGILNFGVAQALKYHSGLESRFELLAQFSRIGMPTYDLSPGLYRYPYKAHMIFYTIGEDHILIWRVLSAAADFKRHF
jgi:toxin ParE1/3/4